MSLYYCVRKYSNVLHSSTSPKVVLHVLLGEFVASCLKDTTFEFHEWSVEELSPSSWYGKPTAENCFCRTPVKMHVNIC